VARKKLLTTKQGRQYRDPWRSLVGRKHYIPTRTGPRKGVKLPTASPYPMPPAGWPGTEPEWAIYWAHLEMGLKPQQDFIYLADSPGTDSIQVDFLELAIPVAIQVQGEILALRVLPQAEGARHPRAGHPGAARVHRGLDRRGGCESRSGVLHSGSPPWPRPF
jgi:hypothetical protein